jgi:uncharacterized protein (DUF1800 family)
MIGRATRNSVAIALICVLAAPLGALTQAGQTGTQAKKKSSTSVGTDHEVSLSASERTLHALNRLTFGPKPGDAEAVMRQGLDEWIEDQLHPESIDDSALDAKLAPYATTRMNPKQLAAAFPSDGVIRQVIAGKRTMPTDAAQKLVYAVNVMKIQDQEKQKEEAKALVALANGETPQTANADLNKDAKGAAPDTTVSGPMETAPAEISPQDRARAIGDTLLAMPKNQRVAALENVPPEQLVNFPNQLRGDQRDRLNADANPQERELLRALGNPQGVVTYELQQAKIMRAVYSRRQLLEVMTDFWMNHFNVYQGKDRCAYYTTAYERDVIRPHALGKFRDLLIATAQSPAMLMYLDNWLSIGPNSAAGNKGKNGLNENYGREVMELHTLGVDGGYTQTDVTELARVLTGWTIANPDDGGQFQFDPKRHEPGTKTVLGEKFYEAGSDEGMRALEMLAKSPATAHFISKSIATRFVSDDPPEDLVQRMSATYRSSDGDIREVMRTMLKSPEFWSRKVYRTKLKTPLEFVVSAVRASGANVTAPDSMLQNLNQMGMQPYGMAVPTGYSMKAQTWETEGSLLQRINFATALTQGKLGGLQFDPGNLVALGIVYSGDTPPAKAKPADVPTGFDAAAAIVESALLSGDLSDKDERIIGTQMQDADAQKLIASSPVDALRLVAGYVLASPDFQRR